MRLALRAFRGGSLVAGGEAKVSCSPGPVAPLNVHVVDLIDEIDVLLIRVGKVEVHNLIHQAADVDGVDGVDVALCVRLSLIHI